MPRRDHWERNYNAMNQKELSELRRRWKPEKNAVGHIYGCFVNSAREIVAELDESLGLMQQQEAEKYLELLRKALSGMQDKNLIDIVFSTQQVMHGEEHRLLSDLRNSELKDAELRRTFYSKVVSTLDMGDTNYLLLLANDHYDVPHRGKDDLAQEDASEEVFSYLVCAVCPVKAGKPELGYFAGDNEFRCTAGQTVSAPELGFLFPTFDDRCTNLYNALFYSRKPEQLHEEFIEAVFHTDPPMSAPEQREAFESALTEALGEECSLNVVQSVHERLTARIEEHKERKDPEPLTVTSGEVSAMLHDCEVPEERVQAFERSCEERFGKNTALNPAVLIDPKRVQITSGRISLSVDPEYSHMLETRVMNGRKVLIVPLEEDLEFNGLPVGITAE